MSNSKNAVATLIAALLGLSVWTGCTGSCLGTGGVVDVCKEGWTPEECADWDDQEVNGSEWTFRTESCPALGYDVQCSDGTWVTSSSDC